VSINATSAVNALGEFWFKIDAERLNRKLSLEFLWAFLRGRRTPVILVVDGHPRTGGKRISTYVDSLRGRLEIDFLPGDAPELNLDEFV